MRLLVLFLVFALTAFTVYEHYPVSYDTMQKSTVRIFIKKDGERIGLCSGVYLGKGKVLTAGHCSKKGTEVEIKTVDGTTVEGKWIKKNVEHKELFLLNDLAMIQTESLPLPAAQTRCKPLSPGFEVYAVGMPGGLSWTVTQGFVTTSVPRKDFLEGRWIQMDLTIMRGNSGGPVFDRFGYLVGIVSHVMNSGRSAMGFIPSPHAYAVSPKLMCEFLNGN